MAISSGVLMLSLSWSIFACSDLFGAIELGAALIRVGSIILLYTTECGYLLNINDIRSHIIGRKFETGSPLGYSNFEAI